MVSNNCFPQHLELPMSRSRLTRHVGRTAALSAAGVFLLTAVPAAIPAAVAADSTYTSPTTTLATGVFTLTTAPGIQPAWDAAGITLTAISPGSTSVSNASGVTKVTLPVVAKTGTANATAGGFRLTNTKTKETVRCTLPTVDTRARVIDCILDAGYNSTLFTIDAIQEREFFGNGTYRTSIFTGMVIKITSSEFATQLNSALSTTVFSSSVTLGVGDLTVTRRLPQ